MGDLKLKMPATGEVGVAALVIAIVSLMILPLPPSLIDMLLAINISISVALLMVTMFVTDVVALSAFPSLLLFTTLYRLSLNIASTKSILLHAEAGHIIDSFGKLVVGGNLVVGLVVFMIITTVQFIVIAKGSERVAEVGARFTLDALPGKQMSIDADLRANNISSEEARRKRAALAVESQLHGGMDGAMKFVKGDAVAGLIITLVNIVAGIAIGVAYHEMTVSDAANRFSILSVGDAMVSQIPSLLLSVAAGVMITRVTDESNPKARSLGEEIGSQLSKAPRALYFASVLLIGFAAVPGFPVIPFLALSTLLGICGWRLSKRDRLNESQTGDSVWSMRRSGSKSEAPAILKRAPQFTCPLGVRIAPDLVSVLSTQTLATSFEAERNRLQETLGLPFPGLAIWVSEGLAHGACELLMYDVPYAFIELPVSRPARVALASSSAQGGRLDNDPDLSGDIGPGGKQLADAKSSRDAMSDWRPEHVIARAAVDMLTRHATHFLGVQEVQWILEQQGRDYPGVVAEVQKVLSVQRIAEVLKRLLEEQVPIRNIRSILESLIVWGPKEKDILMLTEYVRGDLARLLAHKATGGGRKVAAVLFDLQLEQYIRQSIKQTPTGNFLVLPPEEVNALIDQIQSFVGDAPRTGVALVTSMDIRRYVRRLIAVRLDWLSVYSYQELGEHVELQSIGCATHPGIQFQNDHD